MNSPRLLSLALILASLPLSSVLHAGPGAPVPSSNPADSLADKSIYTLFNPTPDNLLRDFAPDRPGFTNGPRTVDAGHFQVETGLFEYGRDHHHTDFSRVRTETFTWGDTELRIGLANWIELDIAIPFYTEQRDKDPSLRHTERTSGIGDLVVGAKINFWGNDGKGTAGGFNLGLKLPTASHNLGNGKVEPAGLFLFDFPLPAGFDLEMNNGVAVRLNDSGHGYHADLINSVAISHPIIGPVSAFVEFYTSFDPKHSGTWVGTTDFGFIWQVTNSLQLDAGMNIGVSRAADDLETFLGVSYRF